MEAGSANEVRADMALVSLYKHAGGGGGFLVNVVSPMVCML